MLTEPTGTGTVPASPADAASPRKKEGDDEAPSPFQQDLAAIREKGFSAFVEDMQKQKMEELRKEILAAMGLTEEALKEMPADQRAAIEKIVAEEIRRRLSAQSTVEDGTGTQGAGNTALAQQVLSTPGGTAPGLIQALEQVEANKAVEPDDG